MSRSDIEHCLQKISEIVTRGDDDRRALLQLGYNLGRLSELTALGREPFWDAWKEPVSGWNRPALLEQLEELRSTLSLDPP